MKSILKQPVINTHEISALSYGDTFRFYEGESGYRCYAFIKIDVPAGCNNKMCYAVRLDDGVIVAVELNRSVIIIQPNFPIEFKDKE